MSKTAQELIDEKSNPIKINEPSLFEIDLGHKKINVRKWKGKDRKNFRNILKDTEDVDKAITEALVYNCLEDNNIALSYDEIQYILIKIREVSIGKTFVFEYKCEDCGSLNKKTINISDINKFKYKKYTPISGVEFQNIPNAKFYKDNKNDDDITELSFYVKSINGNNNMTFNEVQTYFEDLEVNELDKIFEHFYNETFVLDNEYEIKCEVCGNSQLFEFDEIPGFFPDSWLK